MRMFLGCGMLGLNFVYICRLKFYGHEVKGEKDPRDEESEGSMVVEAASNSRASPQEEESLHLTIDLGNFL